MLRGSAQGPGQKGHGRRWESRYGAACPCAGARAAASCSTGAGRLSLPPLQVHPSPIARVGLCEQTCNSNAGIATCNTSSLHAVQPGTASLGLLIAPSHHASSQALHTGERDSTVCRDCPAGVKHAMQTQQQHEGASIPVKTRREQRVMMKRRRVMGARWAASAQRRRSSSSWSTMSWQLPLKVPRSCSRHVSTMPTTLHPPHVTHAQMDHHHIACVTYHDLQDRRQARAC